MERRSAGSSRSSAPETRVFASIQDMVHSLCDSCSSRNIKPILKFQQSPDAGFRSDSGITKPDACGFITSDSDTRSSLSWDRVAFAGQYKKRGESSVVDFNNVCPTSSFVLDAHVRLTLAERSPNLLEPSRYDGREHMSAFCLRVYYPGFTFQNVVLQS